MMLIKEGLGDILIEADDRVSVILKLIGIASCAHIWGKKHELNESLRVLKEEVARLNVRLKEVDQN